MLMLLKSFSPTFQYSAGLKVSLKSWAPAPTRPLLGTKFGVGVAGGGPGGVVVIEATLDVGATNDAAAVTTRIATGGRVGSGEAVAVNLPTAMTPAIKPKRAMATAADINENTVRGPAWLI